MIALLFKDIGRNNATSYIKYVQDTGGEFNVFIKTKGLQGRYKNPAMLTNNS